MLRLFQRRGLLDGHTVTDRLTWQDAGGFSLDASIRIHNSDTAGRERLIRYCARPLFSCRGRRVDPNVTGSSTRRYTDLISSRAKQRRLVARLSRGARARL